MTDTASAIRAFVVENFLFGDTSCLIPDEASLIENGLVDSTGILELVGFLEDHFGITVADSEIVPANLDTIADLSAYVARKLDAAAAAAA
ncbi:acyl carrier protein [Microvirga sp. 2TAF3]|uniref:acyl carrier protein n=1 Tax=Microvirga sp. 2TAF3 TaxID=3233014 RepID=UPI003F94E7B3